MIEDPDPEPSVFCFSNGSDVAIFAANGLGCAVEEADIAVLSPGVNNAFQREFGEFVLKLLAKKKTDRPANFHEVLISLKKVKQIFKSVVEKHDEEM